MRTSATRCIAAYQILAFFPGKKKTKNKEVKNRTGEQINWCNSKLKHLLIGVTAVPQTSCEPVLQNSTEQWGSYSALTCAAVLGCCITAHLFEEQISIGVTAVTHCLLSAFFAEQH